jgi:hypothetical protein
MIANDATFVVAAGASISISPAEVGVALSV